MTNQEKKRWLQEYGKLDMAINQKLDEYERVKSRCEKMGSTITGMPRGGGAGREGWYVRLIELSQDIDSEIDRYVDKRDEIEAAINTVNDTTLNTILRLRYISCMTWEQVAINIGYCSMQVCRLHGRALDEMDL